MYNGMSPSNRWLDSNDLMVFEMLGWFGRCLERPMMEKNASRVHTSVYSFGDAMIPIRLLLFWFKIPKQMSNAERVVVRKRPFGTKKRLMI